MARILVVEDNPANMALVVFLLQSGGHTALSASNAEAGLTLAREEQPSLILMDIQLPGMDGLEAIALLKGDDATRAIPVIALTALAMKGDEDRIRAAGCDGYIAKPIGYQEFLAAIAAQLTRALSPTHIADRPARILIVDDDPQNRQLLEVMLAREGFLLLTASGGEEALAIVAQQPPDLILLDIMMPGMDGCQVATKIKETPATKHIPIIIVTAQDHHHARTLGLSAEADDFLTKPVVRAELCERVKNLLRLKA